MLNGTRVDIPSIRLKAGDKIALRDASKPEPNTSSSLTTLSPAPANLPGWLKVNRKKFEVSKLPASRPATTPNQISMNN